MKKKVKKPQIGLYLDPSLKDEVLAKSAALDRKMSGIIRDLLRRWVAGSIKL